MILPNPYEADRMAEALEAEYDRKCEAFPHCDTCGCSLYPFDTYVDLGGQLHCEKCVKANTHLVSDLEVF